MRKPIHRIARYSIFPGILLLFMLVALAAPSTAAEHRVGLGLHYWSAIDDLVGDGFDVDEDGLSGILSYQYRPGGLISFELDVEYFPDGFGGSNDSTVSPQAYVLIGRGLYAGVGIGVSFSGDFGGNVSDPFYAGRIGFNFALLPRLGVDVNLNYRVDAFNELDNVKSDAITLGAILRLTI